MEETGPFDIIGDVHGCYDELVELLVKLGYEVTTKEGDTPVIDSPENRKVLFVGDYVDRGPKVVEVLRLVMEMHKNGIAMCVPGNHDVKLTRALRGKNVAHTHGLAETLMQLENETPEFKEQVTDFIEGLVSHYVLDEGKLVVAHAGMKQEYQGRASGRVRQFALYGETTGETDEFGVPIRLNWAEEYRGQATVVYGHTSVPEPEWMNRTINIDTGCVYGGKLTAFRYPEKEFVSVPAKKVHYEPAKPLQDRTDGDLPTSVPKDDGILDINDVIGKRIISTRLNHNVTIREENTINALEVMSRFAIDPKWLIYLPPTMSPTETSHKTDLLEHPTEGFTYYRNQGVSKVVWQEKHMGSRAIVLVCKNTEASQKRFGVIGETIGICYTRTGRPFFDDTLENALLSQVKQNVDTAGLWDTLNTDWLCLDCELMPWSVKAQELLRQQYAPVGTSARVSFADAVGALSNADNRGVEVNELLENYQNRSDTISGYVNAYQRYCWPVESISDIKLAPFHLLASEGKAYFDKDHVWHMEMLSKLCNSSENSVMFTTSYGIVDLQDEQSVNTAIQNWEELTNQGGEGIVIKPLDFVVKGKRGLVQPAVKCRGREYLRIIYGPEYTLPNNLERLRARGLSHKRSLAIREFALGVEALERFVNREPLSKVHECVFGVLALESESVDPRL